MQARRSAATLALTASALAFGADRSAASSGPEIGEHFVGVSIEWTLTDRYMGPNSQAAFANLLRNLGSGVLRIGGSSQDQVRFDAAAADTDDRVTPHDLARIRETLNVAPGWVTVLGTAMAPSTSGFPWRTPDHAVAFVRDGDLTYSGDLARYLSEFPVYAGADHVNRWPRVVPASSENIGTWQSFRDRTINTRWFWDWPAILDTVAPTVKEKQGALGAFATDHFYP
jgi:hypothetical protein